MKDKSTLIIFLLLLLAAQAVAINAPTSLTANADVKNRSVILKWDAADGAAGYNIYRKEATEPVYRKINFSDVNGTTYTDGSLTAGNDYLYQVRAVDAGGLESEGSRGVGAPLMTISTSALVTTLRSAPLSARSIRTGKTVTFAGPGDIITYQISYANVGYSSAGNVKINYAIPGGTIIAGAPVVKKGAGAKVAYFDKNKNQWVSRIEKQENIGAVRFEIPKNIPPVKKENDVNGIVDLNVVITL